MSDYRWRSWAVGIVALPLLAACGGHYAPDEHEAELRSMDVDDARALVRHDLLRVPKTKYSTRLVQHFTGAAASSMDLPIERIQVNAEELVITAGSGRTFAFLLRELRPNVFRRGGGIVLDPDYSRTTNKKEFFVSYPGGTDEARVRRVADALYALRQAAQNPDTVVDDEVRFRNAVQRYGNGVAKPPLPEAVIRFKVQAEGAVRDKDFEGAAEFYRQGLKAAPWWAEGYFNRALILAEVGDHDLAIGEMKRYLTLEPAAPNARAARDKIYDWERKAGQDGQSN